MSKTNKNKINNEKEEKEEKKEKEEKEEETDNSLQTDSEIPHNFICPISKQLIQIPVKFIESDQNSPCYDLWSVIQYFENCNDTLMDPLTGIEVRGNVSVCQKNNKLIQKWINKYGHLSHVKEALKNYNDYLLDTFDTWSHGLHAFLTEQKRLYAIKYHHKFDEMLTEIEKFYLQSPSNLCYIQFCF